MKLPTTSKRKKNKAPLLLEVFLLKHSGTVNRNHLLGGNKQVVKYKYFIVVGFFFLIIILTFVHNIATVPRNNEKKTKKTLRIRNSFCSCCRLELLSVSSWLQPDVWQTPRTLLCRRKTVTLNSVTPQSRGATRSLLCNQHNNDMSTDGN